MPVVQSLALAIEKKRMLVLGALHRQRNVADYTGSYRVPSDATRVRAKTIPLRCAIGTRVRPFSGSYRAGAADHSRSYSFFRSCRLSGGWCVLNDFRERYRARARQHFPACGAD